MLASEPKFVPNPSGSDEDDGVLISYIYTANGDQCLVVLDGKTFNEVARVKLPTVFNASFHSSFVAT